MRPFALLALLVAGSIATPARAAGKLRWSAEVSGASAAPPPAGLRGALYAACGARSLALERVAERIAARRLAGRRPPAAAMIARMVQAVGVAQPFPRAWSLVSSRPDEDAEVRRRFSAWLAPARGERRCGIAEAKAAERSVLAAVLVDALADLDPLPRRVRVGGWLTLDAELLSDASDAAVVLLGPDGNPRRILSSFSNGIVRSRFNLDHAGSWTIQVLATLPTGPEPVLQALLFAGAPGAMAAAAEPAPAAEPARTDAQILLDRISSARRARGLSELFPSAKLDRMALDHAKAMAAAGVAAHDVGDGDPVARALAANVRARVVAENVARAADASAAHRALWSSPSHRANILSPSVGRIGIGVVRRGGGLWVVELFTD